MSALTNTLQAEYDVVVADVGIINDLQVNTIEGQNGSPNVTVASNLLIGPSYSATGNFAGNFSGNLAGNVTGNLVGSVTGNVTGNVSGTSSGFTGNLAGQITGPQTSTVIAPGVIVDSMVNSSAAIQDTKLGTIQTAGKVLNSATTATSGNTAGAIIARDSSGNFTAGNAVLSGVNINAGLNAITIRTPGGSTSTNVSQNIGRAGVESEWGVAAGTGSFFSDAVAGDGALKVDNTANKLLLGTGNGVSSLQITSSGVTSQLFNGPLNGNSTGFTGSLAGNVTGTQSSTVIAPNVITNAMVYSAAAIADTKLGVISTPGKVANAATTATNTNVANTIIARDASGNFSANQITANLIGNISGSAASFTGSLAGNITGTQNATVIAAGVIVDSMINASAAITDTKLGPIQTAGKVLNSATTATNANTVNAIVARDANGDFTARRISSVGGGGLSLPSYSSILMSGGNSNGGIYPAFNLYGDGVHFGYNYNSYGSSDGQTPSIQNTGGQATRISCGYNTINIAISSAVNSAPDSTQDRLHITSTAITAVNGAVFSGNASLSSLTVNGGSTASQVLSGSATVPTSFGVGRTSSDIEIGAVGSAGNFIAGAVQGDVTIRQNNTSNKIIFGVNGAILSIRSNGIYAENSLPFVGNLTGTVSNTGSNAFGYYSTNTPTTSGGVIHWSLQNGGLNRWAIGLSTTETGSGNTGSNFNLWNYTDAGVLISNPFSIVRASGLVSIPSLNAGGTFTGTVASGVPGTMGGLTITKATTAALQVFSGVSSTSTSIMVGRNSTTDLELGATANTGDFFNAGQTTAVGDGIIKVASGNALIIGAGSTGYLKINSSGVTSNGALNGKSLAINTAASVSGAISLLSGGSGNNTSLTIGRLTAEGEIGIAAGVGQYATGTYTTSIGDVVLRNNNAASNLIFAINNNGYAVVNTIGLAATNLTTPGAITAVTGAISNTLSVAGDATFTGQLIPQKIVHKPVALTLTTCPNGAVTQLVSTFAQTTATQSYTFNVLTLSSGTLTISGNVGFDGVVMVDFIINGASRNGCLMSRFLATYGKNNSTTYNSVDAIQSSTCGNNGMTSATVAFAWSGGTLQCTVANIFAPSYLTGIARLNCFVNKNPNVVQGNSSNDTSISVTTFSAY